MELNQALVARTDDAIAVADSARSSTLWNGAAEAMFGHSRQKALGASLDLIIPEKFRERHWGGYHQVGGSGESQYVGRTLAVPAVRADRHTHLDRVHSGAAA
jgi:PAS domain S-box-containing protein